MLAVVGWALVVATWTPRGPQTTSEALVSIAVSLAVGALAGWAWRSRWAMLAAPVAFALVVELARIGVVGPSVDAIRTSLYGLFALVSGRVVHGLLSLFPMALGAAMGAGLARRSSAAVGSRRVTAGRVGATLAGLALLALVAGLAVPARTAPITGTDGLVVAGSIAELTTVEVDGRDLGLMIRGHDVDNPVMLFLAGGPGGSELGAMRRHLPGLEEHVTVVTWDQRGTGTSYDALDPTDTLTVDRVVADTIAVTDHLRERFGQDRILLAGQSWGTTLGVLAIQQAPERFSGFVGTGQMVSQRETDRLMYADTLAWARATGRTGLAEHLVAIGPPPYDDMLHYEQVLSNVDVQPYDHSQNSEGVGAWSENFLVEEYTLLDKLHLLAGFVDTYSVLYPQLQEVDFRETATSFEVPMFFVQGAHEARGRAELFDDWYPLVEAPTRDLTTFDTSGHRPLWEQPDEFVDYVTETVLPATADAG
ncbi:alpha/beta fold hydrolase [Salsipaludibacter albus]|uniref:alpha/beta fold hydrolase n=1 Tax=Salsipaludibacter albus TaxID=2849650 RepID=UPI001EE4C129